MATLFKLFGLLLSVSLFACSSSGPKTQYFSLFSVSPEQSNNVSEQAAFAAESTLSFGVGPIIIPEFMDNPGVVSRTAGQAVRVSGQYAWAGDLKTAIARVLATDLAMLWRLDAVWAFPWDNRVRPNYQVRLVFDQFSGVRGGKVHLGVKWTLLNKRGNKVLLVKRVDLESETITDSAGEYVKTLNMLLNQLAGVIAVDVKTHLHGPS